MTSQEAHSWHPGGKERRVSSFDRQSLRLIAAGILEARTMHAAGRSPEAVQHLFRLMAAQRGQIFRGINDVEDIREGYLSKDYTKAFFTGIAALQTTTDPREILIRLRANHIAEEVVQALEKVFDADLPGWRPSVA